MDAEYSNLTEANIVTVNRMNAAEIEKLPAK